MELPGEHAPKLTVWCAKVVDLPEGSFCVALNDPTYLTLVFPMPPPGGFINELASALRCELEHMEMPSRIVRAEVDPLLRDTQFAKCTNRSLLGSVNDVGLHLGWRLEPLDIVDRKAVVEVQHELNVMPHSNRVPALPLEAAFRWLIQDRLPQDRRAT